MKQLTRFSVPDEVGSLLFDDISDRAVRVSWTAPKKSNGILIGYKLSYQIKEKPDTLNEEQLPPNVTSIKVEQLQVIAFQLFWTIAFKSATV